MTGDLVVINGDVVLLCDQNPFFRSLRPRDRLRMMRKTTQKPTMTMAKTMAAMPPDDNLLEARLEPALSPLLLCEGLAVLETLVLDCDTVVGPTDRVGELVGCALDSAELPAAAAADVLDVVPVCITVGMPSIVLTGGDGTGGVGGVAVSGRVVMTVIVIGAVKPPNPVSVAWFACGARWSTLTPSRSSIKRLGCWRCMSPCKGWRQRPS